MAQRPDLPTRMESISRELSGLVEGLSAGSAGSYATIADAIAAVEAAGRLMDAVRVRVLAPLIANPAEAERLGFASPIAAVASIARISERSARARLKVATGVCPSAGVTGAPLPASRAILSDALSAGEIGLEAATLVATELESVAGRAAADVVEMAETIMVGLATGTSPTGKQMVSAVSVDYLAKEIRQVTATVDPDGARPREERAIRRREFRIGAPDEDGLVPVYGRLMPEIGSLLAGLLEAHRRSPRFADGLDEAPSSADDLAPTSDPRTPGQRRHDAIAEIFTAAANTDRGPRLDGAPVTVLVTVSATDLGNPDGLDGDSIGAMAGSPFPVSRSSVERFIDAGGYRAVTVDRGGVVTGIGSPQRCFTPTQRLAIAARDGLQCSTPGCTSPHYTLQAHHVVPWRDDGPTAIDNGILLCYWHHQLVDTGPWQYRIIDGTPYVRGPGIRDWTPTRRQLSRAA